PRPRRIVRAHPERDEREVVALSCVAADPVGHGDEHLPLPVVAEPPAHGERGIGVEAARLDTHQIECDVVRLHRVRYARHLYPGEAPAGRRHEHGAVPVVVARVLGRRRQRGERADGPDLFLLDAFEHTRRLLRRAARGRVARGGGRRCRPIARLALRSRAARREEGHGDERGRSRRKRAHQTDSVAAAGRPRVTPPSPRPYTGPPALQATFATLRTSTSSTLAPFAPSVTTAAVSSAKAHTSLRPLCSKARATGVSGIRRRASTRPFAGSMRITMPSSPPDATMRPRGSHARHVTPNASWCGVRRWTTSASATSTISTRPSSAPVP